MRMVAVSMAVAARRPRDAGGQSGVDSERGGGGTATRRSRGKIVLGIVVDGDWRFRRRFHRDGFLAMFIGCQGRQEKSQRSCCCCLCLVVAIRFRRVVSLCHDDLKLVTAECCCKAMSS